jgi:GT2 family glycosyltransferase
MIPGSAAERTDSKNYAYIAAKRALTDYVKRNKIDGVVENGIFLGSYRIKRTLTGNPKVSIIIPTKDKIEYLKPCIFSILDKTEYNNFEIIILDTGSKEDGVKVFYENLKNNKIIRIIDYPNPDFNFAEANNWVAQFALGEYLLFLNNDTEVINSDWLLSMMEYAQLKNVGIVGAKLLFPNNTIQHIGTTIGIREGASHTGICFPDRELMGPPFLHVKDVARNVSAVTGACLLIGKKLFDSIGGFDKSFKIAFNDTDLCLRVREMGYDIVYTPYAKLIHYESVTFGRPYDNPNRSVELFERERDRFNKKWINSWFEDPFYNKNLTLKDESLSLKI